MLFVVISFIAFYVMLPKFYVTSIDFSDSAIGNDDTSMKTMSLLMGDKKSNKGVEILNLKTSMDFSQMVLSELKADQFYKELVIESSIWNNSYAGKVASIEKKCTNHVPCVDKYVIQKIPSLFEIIDRDRGGVNFTLKVRSNDEFTVKILLKKFIAAINKMRVQVLLKNIIQQEEVTNQILVAKKKELDDLNYSVIFEEKNRLDSELKDVESRTELQGKLLAESQGLLASAESKFKRSKKITSRKVSVDDLENEKKLKDLKDRVEKLGTDINFLENNSAEHGPKDVQIIDGLKKELDEQKKILKKMQVKSRSRSEDMFVKTTDEKLDASEMEFGVLSDQVRDAELQLNNLMNTKNELLSKSIIVNEKFEKLKPAIEFIRSLEDKSEQLKLLKVTVVPDVRFDVYEVPPVAMKPINKVLYFAYVLVGLLLITVVYLIVRYFLDDRIYDEADISLLDSELKTIGNAPRYN